MKYRTISDLFAELATHRDTLRDALSRKVSPIEAGAELALKQWGRAVQSPSIPLINIATAFGLWFGQRDRTVHRFRPETADFVQRVGMGFVPEEPPKSWGGKVFLIESMSTTQELLNGKFSILAYQTNSSTGELRYYFVWLDDRGGAGEFSIRADTGKINERLAKTGSLVDTELWDELVGRMEYTPIDQQLADLAVIRFVFAASYYIQELPTLPYLAADTNRGPVQHREGPTPKGAPPLWMYRDIRMVSRPPVATGIRGPLEKDTLSLEPVVVSPHIRMRGDRVMIIDAFQSTRWKRPDKIGKKLKV